MTRDAAFDALVSDVGACHACSRMMHSHVLGPGNGRLDASVLFVAEAVGRRGGAVTGVPLTRDETGRRFERFLAAAGIARDDCFITNAVLCNPIDSAGRNRPPLASEVARCRPFLSRTLAEVSAPIVVALGRVALESLRAVAPHDATLPAHAGLARPWDGRHIAAMYHPSRQSTLHRSEQAQMDDWRRLGETVRAILGEGRAHRSSNASAAVARYHAPMQADRSSDMAHSRRGIIRSA